MVNYYKQFPKFLATENVKPKEDLEDFMFKMKSFWGFSGKKRTINKWLQNFVDQKLIKIEKIPNTGKWLVIIL